MPKAIGKFVQGEQPSHRPLVILGMTCLLLLSCLSAQAKDSAPLPELLDMELEDLLSLKITGSHIRRVDTSDFGTVSVIDRDAILRSGATSIETLLQRLPESAGYAGNASNAYWSGASGNGSAHFNIRGMGINRTLVLLNGRRLANGGVGANASVDLNMIPLALVESIEVFKGGASAIYGTDAVAGVLNIKTRKNLQKGEANLRYGETFQQDGRDFAADASWGASHDEGSILISASHSGQSAINMADRAACGLGESKGQLICVDSGNTIGGRAVLADGQIVNFNQDPGGDSRFFEPYAASKHNFNVNPYLNAVNPIERTSLGGFGTVKLGQGLSGFAELMYTKRSSEQLASPGTIGLNRPIKLAADHPTNPTGQDLVLQRRRLLEAGTRTMHQDVENWDGVLGLQGQWMEAWKWSLALESRRSTAHDGVSNIAQLDRVDESLDTAVCSNAPGAAIPCANYLGYGNVTSEVLRYIMVDSESRGGNEQNVFSASVNGQPFELPHGPVDLAAGIEVREQSGWRRPDPLVESGTVNENRQESVSGAYRVNEAFAEIVMPLTRDQFWAQSLLLNSALRVSDYELFGQTLNYKFGLNWQLVPSFHLHSSYGTAFRAPNIPELYAGTLNQNLITADPCSGWGALPADSVIYQNCQAAQVPVDYEQLTTSIATTLGGNRNLKPEEATILSLGFIWEPVASLRLGMDYHEVNIQHAIGVVNGGTKLATCYSSPGLSHPFCSSSNFTRNAQTGEINYLSAFAMNEASEHIASVDFALQYMFSLAAWDAKLNWQVSNLRRYDILPFKTAEKIHLAGKITNGRGSYTHWRSLAALSVNHGPWSSSYSLQYIGAADDIAASPDAIGAQVPAVTYHNVQLQYSVAKQWDLSSGIDNIFDREPPFVRSWIDVNTDTMTYDVLGRRWYTRLSYHW